MNENKKYIPYKIPNHNPFQEYDSVQDSHKTASTFILNEIQEFAEIEMDDRRDRDYMKTIPSPQRIEPVMDEIHKTFQSMRQIARDNQSLFIDHLKFYNKKTQYDNAKIFYKQAVFMKDFEDDFTGQVPFSSYFPYYQLLSYEQLRTYFTWRTNVRKGSITNTSLSYAFIYIYELLNNIGVKDPQDGLDKLMSFWKAFKVFDVRIHKYMIMWIKDYHIYYELPKPFKEFLYENHMHMFYPKAFDKTDVNDSFELFCNISKYDIRKSAFYSNETCELIKDCFFFVLSKLRLLLKEADINFDDLIFQTTKKKSIWVPFKGALFYPWLDQPDRRIVISDKELYICNQNKWTFSTSITMESGKQLIGYVMKQMESVIRKITHYKYKLTAKLGSNIMSQNLREAGISIEKAIQDAVMEFYSERNKTVVSVNENSLNRIRKEALYTQEKLIVPDHDGQIAFVATQEEPPAMLTKELAAKEAVSEELNNGELTVTDAWTELKDALNTTEIEALVMILQGNRDIKSFADDNGILLEVLADGINEKAFDTIGDNILELCDGMAIYDEYKENVEEMVGR